MYLQMIFCSFSEAHTRLLSMSLCYFRHVGKTRKKNSWRKVTGVSLATRQGCQICLSLLLRTFLLSNVLRSSCVIL